MDLWILSRMILIQFISFWTVVIIAAIHSYLIRNNKKINHPLWAGINLAVIVASILIFSRGSIIQMLEYLGLGLLIRALFFDLFLNGFRGLHLDYQNPSTNFWDKLVNKVPFWEQKLILLILLVTANIWIS